VSWPLAAADAPGFCDWGVKKQLKDRIKKVLPGLQMPDFIHIVIGGIMLFTAEAVRRFSDATLLMQCIDDLETLYSHKVPCGPALPCTPAALYPCTPAP
jgi:hypothetical protein